MSEIALIFSIFSILLALFVVLVERKFLAYAQRRMGPTVIGRNGAFQVALDLVKLLTKEIFLVPRPSTALAPVFLTVLYVLQLMFSQNFIWGPSLAIFENVDSLILYHLILVLFSNIFFVLVGLISQSRYAIIGTVRALVHVISLDIFVTILYSLLVFSSQSANFQDFSNAQNIYWFFFLYSPAASAFIIILLLEAKRTPFDHSENESEVVAGYAVEYSGGFLMIFFLAEYIHLLISAVQFITLFWGGWHALKVFWFLPPIFIVPHDVSYWGGVLFDDVSIYDIYYDIKAVVLRRSSYHPDTRLDYSPL